MTRIDVIFSVLHAFAPHVSDLDEAPEAKAARDRVTAGHIVAAAKGDRELEAALLVLQNHESHNARWVQAGCLGTPPKGAGTCDGGRSRSIWQVQRKGCPAGWALPRGSVEAQAAFAVCAARLWKAARSRCSSNPDGVLAGAYSGYRSVCVQQFAVVRAHHHTRVLAQLWRPCAGSESGKACSRR